MGNLGRLSQGNDDIHSVLPDNPLPIHLQKLFHDLKGVLSWDFTHGMDAGRSLDPRVDDVGVSQLLHDRIDQCGDGNVVEAEDQAV